MCGGENQFAATDIHEVVRAADRFTSEIVESRYAACHDCGERIDLGAPEGSSTIGPFEKMLALLTLAVIGGGFVAVIWMTRR